MKAKDERARLFSEYIRGKRVLIVDPHSFSRASLAQALVSLGVPATQLRVEASASSARASIAERCPDILLTEYDLDGGACGLELLAEQRRRDAQGRRSLLILVTANSSQAAVAKAAEEDVDGYLLKPYTAEGLRLALQGYVAEKVRPNPYRAKIEEGKSRLEADALDEALARFAEARALDPRPALACYYSGATEERRRLLDRAEVSYGEGLGYENIHYKCLVALFDLYQGQGRHRDAYLVVRRIARHFPANPDRLAEVLRLAVRNAAFEDIEGYLELYLGMGRRDESLAKHLAAALVVGGRHFLGREELERAMGLFRKAMAVSTRSPRILTEIIGTLLSRRLHARAAEVVAAWPPELTGTAEYRGLRYAVEDGALECGVSIARGRELLGAGVREYWAHRTLLARTTEAGFHDEAERLRREVLALWPARAAEPPSRAVSTGGSPADSPENPGTPG